MADLKALIKANRIERVDFDEAQVELMHEQAKLHLASSRTIGEFDSSGAFSLAYDAVRKAMTAVLLKHGLRTKGAGGHATAGQAIAALVEGFDLDSFEWMRLTRNATEYGSDRHPAATEDDLDEAWETADELLAQLEPPLTDS